MSKLVINDAASSKLDSVKKREKDKLLPQANAAYAAMKKNKKEWDEEQEELKLWDVTLEDGLEDE